MIRFITGKLDELGVAYTVDTYGNIYAVKGNARSYPCVVAHTDEVHTRRGNGFMAVDVRGEIILGYDKNTKKLTGIGADDKNGIWICLKCLAKFRIMKCVFFTGEETGCLGSNRADMGFFEDCRFVLQCDRKGNSDLITSISGTGLCSREFLLSVSPKKHGYKQTEGLPTDIYTLKRRGLDVSCVNISCGYYNPHTSEEYTVIEDLHKCLHFVYHIVWNCRKIYSHSYSPPQPAYSRYNNGYGWGHSRYFDDAEDDLFSLYGGYGNAR